MNPTNVDTLIYFVAAYGVFWLGLLVYIVRIQRIQSKLEKKLDRLESKLQ